jgi:glucan phosphorylase
MHLVHRKVISDARRVVYLENYDMALVRHIGTPDRPQKALGISGMKGMLNGVPSLRV